MKIVDEYLSKNFRLSEFLKTSTGIDNTPTAKEIENLRLLCKYVLQPARDKLGLPITVTSGFRSKAVSKAVGGSSTSDHVNGKAADLVCKDNNKLFEIIREMGVHDQLINEFNCSWIHVSYRHNANRKQVLKANKVNGKTVYTRL